MNDVVVRRIFAAGLDLQAGLGLIGDHRGASKIYHALTTTSPAPSPNTIDSSYAVNARCSTGPAASP
jgi:hypothetical protein